MNRSTWKFLFSIFTLLFLATFAVFAGGEGEVEESELPIEEELTGIVTQRRMVFFFDIDETYSQFEQTFVYNVVLSNIYGVNPAVVILESANLEIPPTFEERQDLARSVEADSWVLVQVLGDPSNVVIYHETFDILTLSRIGENTIETGLSFDLRSISRQAFWEDLANSIKNNYDYLIETSQFTFLGLPGTEITGLRTIESATIPDSGELNLELPNYTLYTYQAVLDSYYTERAEVLLGYEGLTVNLEQRRTINFLLGLQFNSLQFLGFHAYWFPIPADLFIRLGFTTYAIGLYFVEQSPNLFRSNPLTVLKLHIGFYILPREELLRPYFAAGAGLRIEHATELNNQTPLLDPYAPVEISLIAGIEYSLPDRFLRFYAEYNPILFITNDSTAFKSRSFYNYLYPEGNIPGFVFADNLVFDLRNFSVGIRIGF